MTFGNIIGNERIKSLLRKSIHNDMVSSAYLFYGPAGAGKTSMAYAFAQALLCDNFETLDDACDSCKFCRLVQKNEYPDLYIIKPSSKTETARQKTILIEQIRELQSHLNLKSYYPKRKIVIIEQADKMNISAANAFLKTLEEPPGETVIILVTDKKDSLLPTIISRCQQIPFVKPGRKELENWLAQRLDGGSEGQRNELVRKYIEYSESNPRYLSYFETIENFVFFAEKIFKHLLTIMAGNDKINISLEYSDIERFFENKLNAKIPTSEKVNILLDLTSIFFVNLLKKKLLGEQHSFPFAFSNELINRIAVKKIHEIIDFIEQLRSMLEYNVYEDLIIINLHNKIGEIYV